MRAVRGPATAVQAWTAQLIAENARAAGASVVLVECKGRYAASIATALDTASCDVLVSIGGSGVGRTDAAIAALAQRGEVLAYGIPLQPGKTSAVGRIARIPVIALPGAPDPPLPAPRPLPLPLSP